MVRALLVVLIWTQKMRVCTRNEKKTLAVSAVVVIETLNGWELLKGSVILKVRLYAVSLDKLDIKTPLHSPLQLISLGGYLIEMLCETLGCRRHLYSIPALPDLEKRVASRTNEHHGEYGHSWYLLERLRFGPLNQMYPAQTRTDALRVDGEG